MKTKDLSAVTSALYKKLEADDCSKDVLDNTKWILEHFKNYCNRNGILEVTVPVAAVFTQECFGFDYYNLTAPVQSVVRRPLLILIEFEESGNYLKTHQKSVATEIPLIYKDLFLKYRNVVNGTSLCQRSKRQKLRVFLKYFEHLEQIGVLDVSAIQFQTVHEYINSFTASAPTTIRRLKTILREIYDWLYSEKYISFSGRQIFPLVRNEPRNKLLSYYSKEEIQQMLSCIDTDTASGKCAYSTICLLAYLGMRSGDVIRLKFSDINWNTETIHYCQQKTGKPLSLPLLDEVKYPLIDCTKSLARRLAPITMLHNIF